MKCSVKDIDPPKNTDSIPDENMAAVENLMAGQFLVDVSHNVTPSECFKEGSPVRRTDEFVG